MTARAESSFFIEVLQDLKCFYCSEKFREGKPKVEREGKNTAASALWSGALAALREILI
jgi:hypothetical protein